METRRVKKQYTYDVLKTMTGKTRITLHYKSII